MITDIGFKLFPILPNRHQLPQYSGAHPSVITNTTAAPSRASVPDERTFCDDTCQLCTSSTSYTIQYLIGLFP